MDDSVITVAGAIGMGDQELVAITGGGGKTSLLKTLCDELPGGVVATATTRLALSETSLFPKVIIYCPDQHGRATAQNKLGSIAFSQAELFEIVEESLEEVGCCLVVGDRQGDKVLGVPVGLPGHLLLLEKVNHVLVEADGSRRLPCKAPGPHEPVIPDQATIVIPTAGIECLDEPLEDIAHRPELVSAITGLRPDEKMTEQALARLITHPNGGLKGVPRNARVVPFINKVDGAEHVEKARAVARLILDEDRIDRVLLGALRDKRPIRETHRRITAVVLAAGVSSRMGAPKQLLPWGTTTVLGQTIGNLQKSLVNEVVVVSGFRAEDVGKVAVRYGVKSLFNEDFEDGGMISSVQTALRSLPQNIEAILVMLADQPMIEPATIDILIGAWLGNLGELIAPVFNGRRGNPVIFGRRYFEELNAVSRGANPRELLIRRAKDIELVEVGSESIFYDLDRLEDYDRWRPRKANT
jgi:molybdenum cofactor cytidylyltransferase